MLLLTSNEAWSVFTRNVTQTPDVLDQMKIDADRALSSECISVVNKQLSGRYDPKDYVSQAPYWWPDTDAPDGLPYIRRDGEVNPESLYSDSSRLRSMHMSFSVLLLYGLSMDSTPHLQGAARVLKTWFLDEETGMNPHLEFAQRIPGHCEGRGIGIIDTSRLCFLLDEVVRLPFNEDWSAEDLTALKRWFSDYLDWLLSSPHGREECEEFNNHGTWYHAQVVAFAYFSGRHDVALDQIDRYWGRRLTSQFDVDGRQPHELARTLSYKYSIFNLLGFAVTAQVAMRMGRDLWNWSDRGSGVCLTTACEWMLPFLSGDKEWDWPQIHPFDSQPAVLLLSMAYDGTGNPFFKEVMQGLQYDESEAICFGRVRPC